MLRCLYDFLLINLALRWVVPTLKQDTVLFLLYKKIASTYANRLRQRSEVFFLLVRRC